MSPNAGMVVFRRLCKELELIVLSSVRERTVLGLQFSFDRKALEEKTGLLRLRAMSSALNWSTCTENCLHNPVG